MFFRFFLFLTLVYKIIKILKINQFNILLGKEKKTSFKKILKYDN